MGKVYSSIIETIGKTPLVRLKKFEQKINNNIEILAKIEMFNPGGSVKDRISKAMIENAEKTGILKEGSVIIEPTSGNTGIGLSAIAAYKGYKIIIVMPDTMSIERQNMMKAFGAEIVLTDGLNGMKGAILKAEELAKTIPESFIPYQFKNKANPEVHEQYTGPEIWEDAEGRIDIFVAGVGTGGTITGVGGFLRTKNPDIKIIAVEPEASPVLSGGNPGPHKIQGIGAGFIPEILDTKIYDEIFPVKNEDAYKMVRFLAREEGIFAGVSSGAALSAVSQIAKRPENSGKRIAVLLPDTGERYLSIREMMED